LGYQIKKNERAGHVASMGERGGAHRVLVGQPEGKRQFGRPSCRWRDNIKMDLQEEVWGVTDWIDRAKHRDRWRVFVIAVMNLWVPLNAGNFFASSGNL
jgi:hypothetical protein